MIANSTLANCTCTQRLHILRSGADPPLQVVAGTVCSIRATGRPTCVLTLVPCVRAGEHPPCWRSPPGIQSAVHYVQHISLPFGGHCGRNAWHVLQRSRICWGSAEGGRWFLNVTAHLIHNDCRAVFVTRDKIFTRISKLHAHCLIGRTTPARPPRPAPKLQPGRSRQVPSGRMIRVAPPGARVSRGGTAAATASRARTAAAAATSRAIRGRVPVGLSGLLHSEIRGRAARGADRGAARGRRLLFALQPPARNRSAAERVCACMGSVRVRACVLTVLLCCCEVRISLKNSGPPALGPLAL